MSKFTYYFAVIMLSSHANKAAHSAGDIEIISEYEIALGLSPWSEFF